MSNFTPLVTKKLKFEDEEVTVRFSRLKRKHVLKHLGMFQELDKRFGSLPPVNEGESDPHSAEKLEVMQPFLEDIGDKLPEYVRDMEGLTDSTGNKITIETVVEDSYFMMLMMDIVMALTEESVSRLGKK